MKKRMRSRAGFTLVEMLVAMLVLVLIAGAITFGMRATSNVFWKYDFASGSDSLSSIVNTSLSDMLRYAEYDGESDGTVIFTNDEYNVRSGCFMLSDGDGGSAESGMLCVVDEGGAQPLVNYGSYGELSITGFVLDYADGLYSGEYTITDGTESKSIDFAFRTLK